MLSLIYVSKENKVGKLRILKYQIILIEFGSLLQLYSFMNKHDLKIKKIDDDIADLLRIGMSMEKGLTKSMKDLSDHTHAQDPLDGMVKRIKQRNYEIQKLTEELRIQRQKNKKKDLLQENLSLDSSNSREVSSNDLFMKRMQKVEQMKKQAEQNRRSIEDKTQKYCFFLIKVIDELSKQSLKDLKKQQQEKCKEKQVIAVPRALLQKLIALSQNPQAIKEAQILLKREGREGIDKGTQTVEMKMNQEGKFEEVKKDKSEQEVKRERKENEEKMREIEMEKERKKKERDQQNINKMKQIAKNMQGNAQEIFEKLANKLELTHLWQQIKNEHKRELGILEQMRNLIKAQMTQKQEIVQLQADISKLEKNISQLEQEKKSVKSKTTIVSDITYNSQQQRQYQKLQRQYQAKKNQRDEKKNDLSRNELDRLETFMNFMQIAKQTKQKWSALRANLGINHGLDNYLSTITKKIHKEDRQAKLDKSREMEDWLNQIYQYFFICLFKLLNNLKDNPEEVPIAYQLRINLRDYRLNEKESWLRLIDETKKQIDSAFKHIRRNFETFYYQSITLAHEK